jgi:hypothetical protein
MTKRWWAGPGTTLGAACLVMAVVVAACTGAPHQAQPHAHPRGHNLDHSHGLVVRAGKYAVTLTPVSPQSLGCTKAAHTLHYPLPCPAMLPSAVLGDYGCGSFIEAEPCGSPPWRGWMAASGGNAVTGPGETPSNDEHFVMEAAPFRTTNYNLIANGPVWVSMGRPHTVQPLGWVTIDGSRMRWIYVSQNTEGSAMAGHIMLVWSAGPHTYALGFHNLWGKPLTEALNVAVAQHLRMVQP